MQERILLLANAYICAKLMWCIHVQQGLYTNTFL